MRTMNAERTAGVLIGLVAFAVAAASASAPKDSDWGTGGRKATVEKLKAEHHVRSHNFGEIQNKFVKAEMMRIDAQIEALQTERAQLSNSGNRRGQPLSSVREKRHDELTMTAGHRITKFARGPGTSPEQLKAILHGVLGHVAAIMKRCNVDYWIVAGTLLGAQRHHGFIPWDNDVDVQLVHSQLEPLKQCLKTIWVGNEEAHFVWMFRTGLHSDIIPIKVADSRSGYYVDVFECHEDTKGGCHTKVFGWSTPLAYVTPTRLCMFDHLVVRCPNDPDRVLKNLYKKGIGILPQHRGLMPPGAVEHTAVQWAESNAEAFLSQ